MSTDRIVSDVLIAAPVARVWDLLTHAEHLGRWFGDAGAEVDLRPGGALSLSWASHGTVRGRVTDVEAPRRFAFRWLSSMNADGEPGPGNSTLVEFTLAEEEDARTRVRVVESGFDALDADAEARTAALASNTKGWRDELAELVRYAEAS